MLLSARKHVCGGEQEQVQDRESAPQHGPRNFPDPLSQQLLLPAFRRGLHRLGHHPEIGIRSQMCHSPLPPQLLGLSTACPLTRNYEYNGQVALLRLPIIDIWAQKGLATAGMQEGRLVQHVRAPGISSQDESIEREVTQQERCALRLLVGFARVKVDAAVHNLSASMHLLATCRKQIAYAMPGYSAH